MAARSARWFCRPVQKANDFTTSMSSLIVYGSLMSKESIAALGVCVGEAAFPVIVHAFRREFTQEPTWRRADGPARGILNAIPSLPDHFAAILLRDIPVDTLKGRIDHRERGYHRICLSSASLSAFGDQPGVPDNDEPVYIYTGKPESRNVRLRPHQEYLRTCIAAARGWGDLFYECFCSTTFVRTQTLSDFLN